MGIYFEELPILNQCDFAQVSHPHAPPYVAHGGGVASSTYASFFILFFLF